MRIPEPLTDFLSKERGCAQRVACRVDCDEIPPSVEVILEGSFTTRVENYIELQSVLHISWGTRLKGLTFSSCAKEHDGVIPP